MAVGGRLGLPRLDGPRSVHSQVASVWHLRGDVHRHSEDLHAVLPGLLPLHRCLRPRLLCPLTEPGQFHDGLYDRNRVSVYLIFYFTYCCMFFSQILHNVFTHLVSI